MKSESEVAQSRLTLRPHGLQPNRLLSPWNFPGKSTGVECHCLLWLCVLSRFNCVQRFATLGTVARQAPLSMRFTRQEYWNRLPFPSPGDPPDPGIEPASLMSPAWAPPREPKKCLLIANFVYSTLYTMYALFSDKM